MIAPTRSTRVTRLATGLLLTFILGTWTMSTATAQDKDSKKVPERKEIDKKYLWATETIYPDPAAWEKDYATLEKDVEKLAALKDTMKQGGDMLLKVMKTRDDVVQRLEKAYVYSSLLADQDTREGATQAMKQRMQTLAVNYMQAASWIEPELTSIPFEKIEGWMTANKELALYRHYFENLFRQKEHILSQREEELIAMSGQVFAAPGDAYNLLTNADIQFPKIKDADGKEVELSDSSFYQFMRSPDRRVRKDAYTGIVSTYSQFRNTAAALLNGAVQTHVFNVNARKYKGCLAAALDTGNIPTEVYDNLVKTVNTNLPLLHRYATMRKKFLKLEDGTHDYDLYTPLTDKGKLEYNYEEAVKAIEEGLAPLGPDYVAAMKKGLDSRWVDVYPTRGKRSGAYSSGTFLTQPYILLNFHGGYDDVSTLAHELGHSMHSYFSRGTQPYIYADYDIFCAEVASTCNEILMQDYVLKKVTDPETKLFLLSEFLESYRGTIFRQTMFSEFEQRIHEMAEKGEPLTADTMGKAYGEIMKKYYGPDYTHDPLVDNYWIRIPHFYYNFYVYKYSTSFCAAANIARRILDKEPGAVEAYLQFLKGGSHLYPIEMLKLARVDMTSPEPIQDAMKLFEKLLDETEATLAKMKK